MIEHLSKQIIRDQFGNAYESRTPSNWDLMTKINELVDEVNKLKTKLEEEQK